MTTERMTSATATSFDRFSLQNAAIVENAAPCDCEAYRDIYTYARWQAQGMQVRKGEHGTKISTYAPITAKDDAGQTVVVGKRPWTSTVFCRHQVEPKATK
jgi:antirestriction protein ArdC